MKSEHAPGGELPRFSRGSLTPLFIAALGKLDPENAVGPPKSPVSELNLENPPKFCADTKRSDMMKEKQTIICGIKTLIKGSCKL